MVDPGGKYTDSLHGIETQSKRIGRSGAHLSNAPPRKIIYSHTYAVLQKKIHHMHAYQPGKVVRFDIKKETI